MIANPVESPRMKSFISFNINTRLLRLTAFSLPFLIALFFLLFKQISDYYYPITHVNFYLGTVREDRIVEWMTAIFFLLSSILSVSIAFRFRRHNEILAFTLYALLGFGLFVIFGEEISWGQRIFHNTSPEFFLRNSTQQEINMHNLRPIQRITRYAYIGIGLYGSILWIAKSHMSKFAISKYLQYTVPGWYLASYFFQVAFFYFYYYYISPINNFLHLSYHDAEVSELILSMGFLLFLAIKYFEQLQEYRMNVSNVIRVLQKQFPVKEIPE